MEIIFTSFHAFFNKDFRLKGQTSIWMFPIYGLAALIHPMHHQMEDKTVLYRGSVYTLGIFTCEYISGSLLKKHHMCPWDYSNAKANVDSVIRLDYAPFWLAAGLIFEKILSISDSES